MEALDYAKIASSGGPEKSTKSAGSISIRAGETSFRGIFSDVKRLAPTAHGGSSEV
jgi:hypothetical protein